MIRALIATASVAAVLGIAVPAMGVTVEEPKNAAQDRPSYTFKGMPEPGEVRRYKGHLLVGSAKANANNAKFFQYMAKVIDLAEQLPKDLRKGADLIQLIAYDPPDSTHPKLKGANNRVIVTGEYRIGGDDKSMGAFVVSRDVTWIAPLKVAYAFVDASLSAKLHRNMLTLSQRLKQFEPGSASFHKLNTKYKMINGLLSKTDPNMIEKFKCEPMRARYAAMKAWKDDKLRLEGQRRRLVGAKCSFKG
ncbi:hypothetical protein V5T82_01935 [Magnetovibrio sp. PR-2]|uniref:hypothetical protein n=1 Tax=Magnetovibrio sp. PR-2 TaxID=3120356 RepID=UPI002FCE2D4B